MRAANCIPKLLSAVHASFTGTWKWQIIWTTGAEEPQELFPKTIVSNIVQSSRRSVGLLISISGVGDFALITLNAGYITMYHSTDHCRLGGVPNASERGTKSEVAHRPAGGDSRKWGMAPTTQPIVPTSPYRPPQGHWGSWRPGKTQRSGVTQVV